MKASCRLGWHDYVNWSIMKNSLTNVRGDFGSTWTEVKQVAQCNHCGKYKTKSLRVNN